MARARARVAEFIIWAAMPLGLTQNWAASRVREHEWYSPLAFMLWGLTRPPFCGMYRLAVRLSS